MARVRRTTDGNVLRTRRVWEGSPAPVVPGPLGHALRHSPAPGSPPGGGRGGGGGAAARGRPEGLTGSAAPSPSPSPTAPRRLPSRLSARPEAEVAPVSEAPAWRSGKRRRQRQPGEGSAPACWLRDVGWESLGHFRWASSARFASAMSARFFLTVPPTRSGYLVKPCPSRKPHT